eukprot:15644866-Heterocapsa_arctica.AAC.1
MEKWLSQMYPQSAGRDQERKRCADGRPCWRQGLPPESSGRWEVKKGDLARAIKQSKNSAPGPDGLPHKAWRELGEFGVDILWGAMSELHEENSKDILEEAYEGAHEFNAGIMACLPKVPVGVTEEGDDIYDAANTRPLSIGNTDNRLMCSAARLRWEAIFGRWVSQSQKGFLRGRSMLSNVLTIDNEAMRVSLQCGTGAIVLFDFKAAFPSIEREFMLKTLRWLGVPERQIRFLETMYHHTKVKIRAAGGEGGWFDMTRGIRQGCPLSPLIFAVVVD